MQAPGVSPRAAEALAQIRQLVTRHPNMASVCQYLLDKRHKAALDRLLHARPDTVVEALSNARALVFWLGSVGHAVPQETIKRMLDSADAAARQAADTRLQAANAAHDTRLAAARAQAETTVKEVQERLSATRGQLDEAQSRLAAIITQHGAAEVRAKDAEVKVRHHCCLEQLLALQCNRELALAADAWLFGPLISCDQRRCPLLQGLQVPIRGAMDYTRGLHPRLGWQRPCARWSAHLLPARQVGS